MYKLNEHNSIQRLSDGASIPLAEGNRDYQEYLIWLSEGNIPEPAFTDLELAQQAQDKINQEALSYLASTDWYITRQTETGVVVPADVLTKRQAAREEVV